MREFSALSSQLFRYALCSLRHLFTLKWYSEKDRIEDRHNNQRQDRGKAKPEHDGDSHGDKEIIL